MWLALKQTAARKPRNPLPDLGVVQNALGNVSDAVRYRRLVDEFPDVELGPDEDIVHHFSRLRAAKGDWLNRDTTDVDRRARDTNLQKNRVVVDEPDKKMPSWVTGPSAPASNGLPQRVPGWFTGDATDAPPPGYGVPPMSQRDPMATRRAPVSPSAQPPQQSMGDWKRWLADKGIYLDQSGQRISPEQMKLPRRPLTGPQIWHPFTSPAPEPNYAGRHRAAKIVIAYIMSALSNKGEM